MRCNLKTMRKIRFVNGEFFHVYNRGVDKRKIFLDDGDCLRFLKELKFFNTESPSWISTIDEKRLPTGPEDRIVDIVCYCLMPNHYHLLLRSRVENGITKFMRKLNTGYTVYFNIKHQRVGRLFENRFKAVHIDADLYFRHLTRYIHLNPLDLYQSGWREGKIENLRLALEYLESYRWSSYTNYVPRFKSDGIINSEFLAEIFKGENYRDFVADWTSRGLEEIKPLTLE